MLLLYTFHTPKRVQMNTDTYIEHIQRLWRLKRLQRSLNVLNFRTSKIQNLTFDQLTMKIRGKPFLKFTHHIMNQIKRISYIECKNTILFSAFVMYYHPEDTLSNECVFEKEGNAQWMITKECMYDSARIVVETFDNMCQNASHSRVVLFSRAYAQFEYNFHIWKMEDKNQIIQVMIASHHELEMSKNLILRNRTIEELNEEEKEFVRLTETQQSLLAHRIQQIKGNSYSDEYFRLLECPNA